ncbi:hypothetical protein Tco_1164671 [Tanacetum coccineum]
MPTEMELTLEQTQQGVSYEVSKDSILQAGNHVKEILLKLNLPDHRKLKDGGEVKEFQRSFRHSDTERLSRSDEVLKLKNFKKDATLKLFKSTNQERSNLIETLLVMLKGISLSAKVGRGVGGGVLSSPAMVVDFW